MAQALGALPDAISDHRFRNAAVRDDARTDRMRGENLAPWTLAGRVEVTSKPAVRRKRLLTCGKPKEAERVFPNGRIFRVAVNAGTSATNLLPVVSRPSTAAAQSSFARGRSGVLVRTALPATGDVTRLNVPSALT